MPAIAPARPHTPAQLARDLAADRDRWLPQVRFDPDERVAVRLDAADQNSADQNSAGDNWEAWLLTWLPGQGTGLHDHGGAAGAFVTLRGSLQETTLARAGSGRFRPVTSQGHAPTVRAFGEHHLHDVLNVDSAPAVSLHVYAPVLSAMTRYRLDGAGRLTVLAREQAGADW